MTGLTTYVLLVAAAVAAMRGEARADGDEQAARALFQRAEASFQEGRFGEALKDYQSAYQRKPLPGFLFDIGQCYRRVGFYKQARIFFRRFIRQNPPAAQRRVAQGLLDDLDRLEAQQRRVSAEAEPARPPVIEEEKPAARESVRESLLLTAVDPAPLPPGSLEVPITRFMVREPARPALESERFYQRWWFWTLLAGAVAGGVATAIIVGNHQSPEGSLPSINAAGGGP